MSECSDSCLPLLHVQYEQEGLLRLSASRWKGGEQSECIQLNLSGDEGNGLKKNLVGVVVDDDNLRW